MFLCALSIWVTSACEKSVPPSDDAKVSHSITRLSMSVGSIWGGGFALDVVPEEYAVIENEKCPLAKEAGRAGNASKGFCVVRITKAQSQRFEQEMERYRSIAVPLEKYKFGDAYARPDGKRCRNTVTDSTSVLLMWTGTEGVRVAEFYLGCDPDELSNFYKQLLSITDALPIQNIIKED